MVLEPETLAEVLLPPALPGRDEMNFAEFPMALLTDRVPKGQTSIKFEDQIYDERRKKLITRKRVIEGSEEYGLPTATDDRVVLALIQLTKLRSDFTSRSVDFTRLELIKLLGWEDEGRNYDRIKLSLQRVANVTYNYDNAWWDNRQKRWTTKIFHILETVEINDSRTLNGQGGLFPSRITWNEVVFDSLQAGYVRNIDFELCMQLEHAIALRLYRFLGKRFYFDPDLTFDLKEVAHDHLGLGRNYEGGAQIARKLLPAIRELEDEGFLLPLSEAERFPRKGRAWSVRFIQNSTSVSVAIPLAPPAEPIPSPLLARLIERKVGDKVAGELVSGYPPELVAAKIAEFDWLMTTADKPKKPAGYLVKSITDGYGTPPGFVSPLEQQAKTEAEGKRADDAALKRQAQAREAAVQAEAAAYLKQLGEQERSELEARAIAEASPETRTNLENPSMAQFRDTFLAVLVREYVERHIRGGKLPVATKDAPSCSAGASQDSEPPFRLSN